jgi:hypothetical protein
VPRLNVRNPTTFSTVTAKLPPVYVVGTAAELSQVKLFATTFA